MSRKRPTTTHKKQEPRAARSGQPPARCPTQKREASSRFPVRPASPARPLSIYAPLGCSVGSGRPLQRAHGVRVYLGHDLTPFPGHLYKTCTSSMSSTRQQAKLPGDPGRSTGGTSPQTPSDSNSHLFQNQGEKRLCACVCEHVSVCLGRGWKEKMTI